MADRADSFLELIRRTEQGRHKIYLGFAAGVGKTCRMLDEGQRLKSAGLDVVVGWLETHGRKETAARAEGLELQPPREMTWSGTVVKEMDLDGLLRRKPQICLVDELAHSNVPGSRHAKRWEDVRELLDAGIHVISTVNVQHLESLFDTVEKATGVKVRERLPDAVLAQADEVVNIDLSSEDLIQRLKDGKIYPPDRAQAALQNFFLAPKLEQLRELTLRELASQLDLRRRGQAEVSTNARDQVMVALSAHADSHPLLLRHASRMAGRLNRNWYAVTVQTEADGHLTMDSEVQRRLGDTLTLANQLGAMVFTLRGSDVASALLSFARQYQVGHLVIGRPQKRGWFWQRGVVERLLDQAQGLNLIVVDTPRALGFAGHLPQAGTELMGLLRLQPTPEEHTPSLHSLLKPTAILIWDQSLTKEEALSRLVETVTPERDLREKALEAVLGREREGSTFLNEGIALPHARVPDLSEPRVALGIPRAGVAGMDAAMDAVLLILSPDRDDRSHLELLAIAGHLFQRSAFRQGLRQARSADEVLTLIKAAES
jgi:two-component system sensor histidine kinase KdpD